MSGFHSDEDMAVERHKASEELKAARASHDKTRDALAEHLRERNEAIEALHVATAREEWLAMYSAIAAGYASRPDTGEAPPRPSVEHGARVVVESVLGTLPERVEAELLAQAYERRRLRA